MTDRLISSYVVPVVIIFGASLQKNFQSVHILLSNNKLSQFNAIGWTCIALNFVLLLCQIVMQDFTVSPYNLSTKSYAVYNFKSSTKYKVLLAASVVGILMKLVNIILAIILNAGVIGGTYASQLQSPWAKPQSYAVIIAAFYETVVMVSASAIFIYSIASKLGISRMELFSQLFIKYAAFDYIIMAGLKIYACVGFGIVIKNNFVPSNIYLSANGAGMASAIFATYIFIHASFNAPKQLLSDYSVGQ
ncbi:hypothetical protein HDV01_006057 [Terramyces sp. JEL0728]|nr:hypothetical protein HDV01_006057 [Terramyces sp. JEL0728]